MVEIINLEEARRRLSSTKRQPSPRNHLIVGELSEEGCRRLGATKPLPVPERRTPHAHLQGKVFEIYHSGYGYKDARTVHDEQHIQERLDTITRRKAKSRKTLLLKPGKPLRYRFLWKAKRDGGKEIMTCYSVHPNAAGYFLGWTETITKQRRTVIYVERTDFIALKARANTVRHMVKRAKELEAKMGVTSPALLPAKLPSGPKSTKIRCLEAAQAIAKRCGVRSWEFHTSLSGRAYIDRGHIKAPKPTTVRRLQIWAHECAHIENKLGPKSPTYLYEYRTERRSLVLMSEAGVEPTDECITSIRDHVSRKLGQAKARGLQQPVPIEVTRWLEGATA